MSKFQFPESIKSRPVYGTLTPRPGKAHLMIADAEGAEAILDLASAGCRPDFKTAHIIFIPKETGDTTREPVAVRLNACAILRRTKLRSLGSAYPPGSRLTLNMGLQLYLCGTEGLMGQAQNEAMSSRNSTHSAIQTEHRGSVARRMQCVHCKGITEDVMTDPVRLRALRSESFCARPLFPPACGVSGCLHRRGGPRKRA